MQIALFLWNYHIYLYYARKSGCEWKDGYMFVVIKSQWNGNKNDTHSTRKHARTHAHTHTWHTAYPSVIASLVVKKVAHTKLARHRSSTLRSRDVTISNGRPAGLNYCWPNSKLKNTIEVTWSGRSWSALCFAWPLKRHNYCPGPLTVRGKRGLGWV